MKEDNFNNLPDNHRVEVPKHVWARVENKIQLDRKKVSIKRLKTIMAVAASFVLIAAIGVMTYIPNNQKGTLLAKNSTYTSMLTEQLSVENQPIYNQTQLEKLNRRVLKDNPSFFDKSNN